MPIEDLTLEETSEALFKIAIKDIDHLKRWLHASKREFLVFNAIELADALPFPEGHNHLIQLIALYRDHRSTSVDTVGKDGITIMKSDKLTIDELDRAIRFLVGMIREKLPDWDLSQKPL